MESRQLWRLPSSVLGVEAENHISLSGAPMEWEIYACIQSSIRIDVRSDPPVG